MFCQLFFVKIECDGMQYDKIMENYRQFFEPLIKLFGIPTDNSNRSRRKDTNAKMVSLVYRESLSKNERESARSGKAVNADKINLHRGMGLSKIGSKRTNEETAVNKSEGYEPVDGSTPLYQEPIQSTQRPVETTEDTKPPKRVIEENLTENVENQNMEQSNANPLPICGSTQELKICEHEIEKTFNEKASIGHRKNGHPSKKATKNARLGNYRKQLVGKKEQASSVVGPTQVPKRREDTPSMTNKARGAFGTIKTGSKPENNNRLTKPPLKMQPSYDEEHGMLMQDKLKKLKAEIRQIKLKHLKTRKKHSRERKKVVQLKKRNNILTIKYFKSRKRERLKAAQLQEQNNILTVENVKKDKYIRGLFLQTQNQLASLRELEILDIRRTNYIVQNLEITQQQNLPDQEREMLDNLLELVDILYERNDVLERRHEEAGHQAL